MGPPQQPPAKHGLSEPWEPASAGRSPPHTRGSAIHATVAQSVSSAASVGHPRGLCSRGSDGPGLLRPESVGLVVWAPGGLRW